MDITEKEWKVGEWLWEWWRDRGRDDWLVLKRMMTGKNY